MAKAIDIPTSLIFYYFKNKEDMLYQLVDQIIAECEASYFPEQEFIDDDKEFIAFVERALKVHKYREKNTPVNAIIYHTYIFKASMDENIKKKHRVSTYGLLDKYSERLRYYNEKGIIHIDDPAEAARLLECLINGLGNVWAIYTDEEYDYWSGIIIDSFLTTVKYAGHAYKLPGAAD